MATRLAAGDHPDLRRGNMLRLTRTPIIVLFCLMSIGCSSIIYRGSVPAQTPTPSPSTILSEQPTFQECAIPSWIGIVPGESNLAEAKTFLENEFGGDLVIEPEPNGKLEWSVQEHPLISDGYVMHLSGDEKDVVSSIGVNFRPDTLNLEAIEKLLGEPKYIRGMWVECASLVYPKEHLLVISPPIEGQFSRTQNVEGLVMFSSNKFVFYSIPTDIYFIDWKGFTSYDLCDTH